MALNWDWKDRIGYLVLDIPEKDNRWENVKVNLYGGNALMIGINEWKEDGKDMYSLFTFFADEQHAKNCLGLAKNEEYIMHGILEVHLWTDMKDKRINKLVKLWTEAIQKYKLDVKVVLEYHEE